MLAKSIYWESLAIRCLAVTHTHLELLRAAGADKAEAIVLCTDSPDEIMKTSICVSNISRLKILARARSRVEAYQLLNHGGRVTTLVKLSLEHWI